MERSFLNGNSHDQQDSYFNQSKHLCMYDYVFLKTSPKDLAQSQEQLGSIAPQWKTSYMSCVNPNGGQLNLTTEQRMKKFPVIAIFRLLPHISFMPAKKVNIKAFRGEPIRYGQHLTLKHIFSGQYLDLDLETPSSQGGTWQVKLSKNLKSTVKFLPCSNLASSGQAINLNSDFQISIHSQGRKSFLTCFKEGRYDWRLHGGFSSNKWGLELFQESLIPGSSVVSMKPLYLKAVSLNLNLSVKPDKNDKFTPSIPKCQGIFNFQKGIQFQFSDYKFDTKKIWILQKVGRNGKPDRKNSSAINYYQFFFIRNVSSMKYITGKLSLVDQPSQQDIFHFKSKNKGTVQFQDNLQILNHKNQCISTQGRSIIQQSLSRVLPVQHQPKKSAVNTAPVILAEPKGNYQSRFQVLKPNWRIAKFVNRMSYTKAILKEFITLIQDSDQHFVLLRELAMTDQTTVDNVVFLIIDILTKITLKLSSTQELELYSTYQGFIVDQGLHLILLEVIQTLALNLMTGRMSLQRFDIDRESLEQIVQKCWKILKQVSLYNTDVCSRMISLSGRFTNMFQDYPFHVGKLLALITDTAYPDFQHLQKFLTEILYQFKSLDSDNIREQRHLVTILYNTLYFKGHIIQENQRIIRAFLTESNKYIPMTLEVNNDIIVKFMNISNKQIETFRKSNAYLAVYSLQNNYFSVYLDQLKDYKQYQNYFQNFFYLVEGMTSGLPLQKMQTILNLYGVNQEIIVDIITDQNLSQQIKQPLLSIAVNFLSVINNHQWILSNHYCLSTVEKLSNFRPSSTLEYSPSILQIYKQIKSFWKTGIQTHLKTKNKLSLLLSMLTNTTKALNHRVYDGRETFIIVKGVCFLMRQVPSLGSAQEHPISGTRKFMNNVLKNTNKHLYKLKFILNSCLKILKYYCDQFMVDQAQAIKRQLLNDEEYRKFRKSEQKGKKKMTFLIMDDNSNAYRERFLEIVEKFQFDPIIKTTLMNILLSDTNLTKKDYTLLLELIEITQLKFKPCVTILDKVEIVDASKQKLFLKNFSHIIQKLSSQQLLYQLSKSKKTHKHNKLDQIVTEILKLIQYLDNIKQEDQYYIFHIQNIMRNYGVHLAVFSVWKILCNWRSYDQQNDRVMYTINIILTFLYYFIKNNLKNRQTIKYMFSHDLFCSQPILGAVLQLVTNFSYMNTEKIGRFTKNLLKQSAFKEYRDSRIGLNWIKAILFRHNGRPDPQFQLVISEHLFSQIFLHFELLQQHKYLDTFGELFYLLSLTSIDNRIVKSQCQNQFSLPFLLGLFSYNDFELEKGALNLTYYTYFYDQNPSFEQARPFIKIFSKRIHTLIENIDQVVKLALQGYIPILKPIEQSYKIELNYNYQSPNQQIRNLFWLFSYQELLETNPDKSGFIYFINKINANQTQESPEKSGISLLDAFREKVIQHPNIDWDQFMDDLQICIYSLKNDTVKYITTQYSGIAHFQSVYVQQQSLDIYQKITTIPDVQYYNFMIKDFRNEYLKKNFLSQKQYYKWLTKLILQTDCFKNLQRGKIDSKVNKQLISFFESFLNRSMSEKQVSFFYGIYSYIFKNCKTKQKINQIIIESKIIDISLKILLNSESILIKNSSLSFLTVIVKQSASTIRDFMLQIFSLPYFYQPLLILICNTLNSVKQRLTYYQSSIDYQENLKKQLWFKSDHQFQLAVNLLQFVSALCDNCFTKFQILFASHNGSAKGGISINLVSFIFEIIVELTQNNSSIQKLPQLKYFCMILLQTIIEFITGPCYQNQAMFLKNIESYFTINSLLNLKFNFRSKYDLKLYQNIVIFLSTFTQGDPKFPVQMAEYLNIPLLIDQIYILFSLLKNSRMRGFRGEISSKNEKFHKNVLSIGTQLVIFLLKFEQNFPYNVQLQELLVKQTTHDRRPSDLLISKQTLTDRTPISKLDSIVFFKKYVGQVQIEREGKLFTNYYQIPYRWNLLTNQTAYRFIQRVDHTSRTEKLENLIHFLPIVQRELKHQLKIEFKYYKPLTKHWEMVGYVSFVFIIAVNMFLLWYVNDQDLLNISDSTTYILMVFTSTIQMILIILSVGSYIIQYYPVIIMKNLINQGRQIQVSQIIKDQHSFKKNNIVQKQPQKKSYKLRHLKMFYKIRLLLKDTIISYYILFFIFATLAIFNPLFIPVLLLDIVMKSQALQDILRAVSMNWKQLALTFIFSIMCIMIFSVFAYMYLSENYIVEGNAQAFTFCGSLWQCYVSTLYHGLRSGGGIGDALEFANFDEKPKNYYYRVVFDLVFFLVITIILLNVVFGIIIDTFAQLRDQRQLQKKFKEEYCYICHQKRSQIQIHDEPFVEHVWKTHNLWSYLAFFCYLNDKKLKDCKGLEQYVKYCIENNQISFFPSAPNTNDN